MKKEENEIWYLTPKGLEMGKIQTILYVNELTKGKCPFCKIESYKDEEYTYIPYDYDVQKKLVYCKQCGETIITIDEMLETLLDKIKEENE
jgi:C4-type Zn-finger protein